MIIVAGHIRTESALVVELADTLRALVATTLREDGCLAYHFAVDDADEGTVLVYERWRDEAALATHLAQPAVAALLCGWAERIDVSGVRKFDVSAERGFMD